MRRLDGRGEESLDVRYEADPEFAAYVDAYEEPSGHGGAPCDSALWEHGGPAEEVVELEDAREAILFGGVLMLVEHKDSGRVPVDVAERQRLTYEQIIAREA